jgi:hypothetical protein
VNTWNHIFSKRDNNPGTAKTEVGEYRIYWGSRRDVEELLRRE